MGNIFKGISTYQLENERKLTKHYLKNWYLKPNLEKLESDTNSIMKVKEIKYNAILHNKILESDYQVIVQSLKTGSKKTWEPLIELLEAMTSHFPAIKDFVNRMTDDSNGFIRETALLIMEDGNFSFEERKRAYEKLSNDRNKMVKQRVLDMIYREGKKRKQEFEPLLNEWKNRETDVDIKQIIDCL
jgi:hypothetical protein